MAILCNNIAAANSALYVWAVILPIFLNFVLVTRFHATFSNLEE